MSSKDDNSEKRKNAQSSEAGSSKSGIPRRNFIMVAMTLGAVFVTAGIASVAKSLFAPSTPAPAPPPSTAKTVTKTVTTTLASGQSASSTAVETSSTSTVSSPFPQVVVANISDLASGKPLSFNYPLEETPNLLVKLGSKAEGGVGPDGDIVAFSQFCQHLGCVYGYVPTGTSPACDSTFKAEGPVGYCCCHGTIFDLANAAKVLGGPAPRPVPQVLLSFDAATGNITATGMGPPTIFGHTTGSSDVLNDLQGGTVVSG